MKVFKHELSLVGKIEEITMMDLRQQPGEIVDRVIKGETFLLTRQGKYVAIISAPPGQILTMNINKQGKISGYSLES